MKTSCVLQFTLLRTVGKSQLANAWGIIGRRTEYIIYYNLTIIGFPICVLFVNELNYNNTFYRTIRPHIKVCRMVKQLLIINCIHAAGRNYSFMFSIKSTNVKICVYICMDLFNIHLININYNL